LKCSAWLKTEQLRLGCKMKIYSDFLVVVLSHSKHHKRSQWVYLWIVCITFEANLLAVNVCSNDSTTFAFQLMYTAKNGLGDVVKRLSLEDVFCRKTLAARFLFFINWIWRSFFHLSEQKMAWQSRCEMFFPSLWTERRLSILAARCFFFLAELGFKDHASRQARISKQCRSDLRYDFQFSACGLCFEAIFVVTGSVWFAKEKNWKVAIYLFQSL